MNKTFEEVQILLVLPDKANPETVLRTLGKYYRIDRVAEPVEGDPKLFFIKEIERPKEEKKEEIIKAGVRVKKSKVDKVIDKII